MLENKWNELPSDVWAKIFIDYFTYDELIVPYYVCKGWRSVIITSRVSRPIMAMDGLNFVEGEHWLKTFAQRKIVVALDCSLSMMSGTENWRYQVAVAEAKSIATRFSNFAAVKGIILMPFANLSRPIVIKHADEIDEKIADITSKHEPDGIGETNNWTITCKDIFDQILLSPKRTCVYLLSDIEIIEGDPLHELWTTAYKIPPIMYLCRIGNSVLGERFVNSILNLNPKATEPVTKKRRTGGKLTFFQKHIPSNDGLPEEEKVTLTPTVVIEENHQMDMDIDDDDVGEEPLESTEVVEDEEYYPPYDDMEYESSEY